MMQWAAIEEDEMRRLMMVGLAAGVGLAACQTLPAETAPATAPQPAPPPPDASFIPAGTVLNVELNNDLNTTTSRVGDTFTVTVTEPLIATNAQVVVPEGAVITGMVTGVGAVRGEEPAAVRLNFLRINIRGISHPLTAEIASTHVPTQEHAGDAARAAATGAAAGAVLGAILTGELRDALIGAALGAGAGTIISMGTGDVEAVLPEGTRMTIRTFERISLR
jgi:hypothetical protein